MLFNLPCSQKLDPLLSNSNPGGNSSLKKSLGKKKKEEEKKVPRQRNWKFISLKLTIKKYYWIQTVLNHLNYISFKASCYLSHCAADLLMNDAFGF